MSEEESKDGSDGLILVGLKLEGFPYQIEDDILFWQTHVRHNKPNI